MTTKTPISLIDYSGATSGQVPVYIDGSIVWGDGSNISNVVDPSSLTNMLLGYVTSTSLATSLANYALKTSLATYAPLASPTFTGSVLAPTFSASAFAKVGAQNTSAQSIPASTAVVITGWTKDFDANSNFNVTTGVFTAPSTGYYLFSGVAQVFLAGAAVGIQVQLKVMVNGVVKEEVIFVQQLASNNLATMPFSVFVSMTSGQTANLTINQTSTASQTLNTDTGSNRLSIVQLP